MISNLNIKIGRESASTLSLPLPQPYLVGGTVMDDSVISKRSLSGQVKKICEVCGSEFWVSSVSGKNRRYCSQKCTGIGQSIQIKKICEVCGIEFCRKKSQAKKAKFCSKECAYLSFKKKDSQLTYKCDVCGVEFTRYASAQKSDNKFCSKKCAAILISNRNKERSYTPITVTCACCEKRFIVEQSEYNAPKNKDRTNWFCSSDCYHSFRSGYAFRGKVEVVCYWCGKPKEVPFGQYQKGGHFFCDKECQSQYMSEFMDGKKSPFYKDGSFMTGRVSFDAYHSKIGYAVESRRSTEDHTVLESKCAYCGKWFNPSRVSVKNLSARLKTFSDAKLYCSEGCKEACPVYRQTKYPKGFKRASSREVSPDLRQMCLERDGWKCQKCGKTEPPLHCHHIEGATQNKMISNDIDNVITLCKACHKEVHKQPGCGYHELQCKGEEKEICLI